MKCANGSARIEQEDDRSLLDLVRDLRDDAVALLRQELKLLSTELRESAKSVATNSVLLLVGVFTLFLALQGLIVTIGIALTVAIAQVIPMQAAMIVGPAILCALLAIGGWLTLQRGLHQLKHIDVAPRRTVESIKETRQWLTESNNPS